MRSSAEPLFPEPVLDALRGSPDRPAFEHGSRTVSYGEVLETIRRLACGMRSVGLGPGRGVAMVTSLSLEGFAANVAAHALGCRVAGVRPGWSTPQLVGALGAQIDAVVVDPETVTPELLKLAGPAAVLSLGSCPAALDLFACPDDGRPVAAEARADDIARVNFTSGSTGKPKGCARTYRTFSLAYQPARWTSALTRLLAQFERFPAFSTWSSPAMLAFAGRCLLVGGTVIIPEEDDQCPFLPYAIERRRITAALTTVPRLRRMLDVLRDDPVDVSCLRAVMVTGSPASPQLLAEAVDRLGPVLWQGYGQGESGMISMLTPEDIATWPTEALTSVGRPLPNVEVSVRDSENRPVREGEDGQIYVRSPHLMAGYWGDRHQTDEVLRDGWLDTRDRGHLDGTGFLYLTGRSRDVIIVNGQVCYAGPIERVLAGHPDVDQAYVAGAPDDQTGEAIHAFVVPSGGRAPDRQMLAKLVHAELGAVGVPKTITVVRDVPVAASGKPDKRALLSRHRPPAG